MQDNDLTANQSPKLIDIIDLTKGSPTIASTRSRRRFIDNADDDDICETSISCSITYTLRNNQRQNSNEPTNKDCNVKYPNEIVTIDDTICIEDDVHYATESDNREPIPLTCPICFELLCSKLKPTTTRCGHIFCAECLKTYFRTSKKCPTCKANITLKTCTRLYL